MAQSIRISAWLGIRDYHGCVWFAQMVYKVSSTRRGVVCAPYALDHPPLHVFAYIYKLSYVHRAHCAHPVVYSSRLHTPPASHTSPGFAPVRDFVCCNLIGCVLILLSLIFHA